MQSALGLCLDHLEIVDCLVEIGDSGFLVQTLGCDVGWRGKAAKLRSLNRKAAAYT
jgi:hypothetical protein